MVSLYDLELQESNNFIQALMDEGQTPALKSLRSEIIAAQARGEAGQERVRELTDPFTESGKLYLHLKEIETETRVLMAKHQLTSEDAKKAHAIFAKKADSFSDLDARERQDLNTYWVKKKAILSELLDKGYTVEELHSQDYYQVQ